MVEKRSRQFEPPPKQTQTQGGKHFADAPFAKKTSAKKTSENKMFANKTLADVPFAEAPDFDAAPFQRISTTGAELVSPTLSCVEIDLETLGRFEVVEQQFRQWGVVFANAIALPPSNPAFPTRAGSINALIGSPKSGWIEAKFDKPVRLVKGRITSSRRMTLVAFDQQNHLIAQTEIPQSNLAGSGSPIPPNTEIKLQANNIHRIIFQSFDGQLTLSEFGFGF